MEDEVLYKSPDGSVFAQSQLLETFGENYQDYIDDGQLQITDENPSTDTAQNEEEQTLDENSIYVSPDGTIFTAEQALSTFGDDVYSYIKEGQLKKKEQYGVGSLPGETTGSLLEPKLIEDTLLESSPQLLTQNNQIISNIVIDGTPLNQMSAEDQQQFYKELEIINSLEKRQQVLRESPVGSGITQDVIEQNQRLYNLSFPKDAKGQKIRQAALDFTNPSTLREMNRIGINPKEVVNNYFGAKAERGISFNEEGEVVSSENKSAVPSWVTAVEPETQSTGGPEKFLGFIPNPFHYSKEEVKEIDQQRKIDENILDKYSISNDDFNTWLDRNGKSYSFFEYETLDFLTKDEKRDKLVETLHYRQLMGYTATIGNQITSDLNVIKNTLQFETDPAVRRKLLNEQSQLEQSLIVNVAKRNNLIKEFPKLMEEQEAEQARNAEYIEAVRNGSISEPVWQVLKKTANAGDKFLMGVVGFFPEIGEQLLDGVGLDESGVAEFLGIFNDGWQDAANDPMFGKTVDTRAVQGMKEVTIQWNGAPLTVGLTEDGNIVDAASGASMGGLLTADQTKEVIEKADLVPEFEDNWSLEGSVSGTTSTIVNLFGLIYGGKAVTKSINGAIKKTGSQAKVGGGVGMGLASYATQVADEVSDIENQLLDAGIPYDEARSMALMYGNGRASLDGIFSAFAGGNTKLLAGLKSAPKTLIDLAKNPNLVRSQVFQQKLKDLGKENAKELFIEELPVLVSGDFINSMANDALGQEILREGLTSADVKETILLTLGATTGLGSARLLKGNSRKDLLRIASESTNIEKDLNEAVNKGYITRKEAAQVYAEVYSMQTGLNQTKGTVIMPGNIENAASLLTQREKLMEKRKGLEGKLKEDIDKKIADVDSQISALKEQDTFQAQAEKNSKTNQQTAVNELVNEGIKNPTNQQIYEKQQELVKKLEDVVPGTETDTETDTKTETDTEGQIETEQQITDEQVIERIKQAKDGSEVYTQEEFDNMKALMEQENNIKKQNDAIQKQETGNISQDQQSETTQEVEEEVREPSVEAETPSIDPNIDAPDTSPNRPKRNEEDLVVDSVKELNKKTKKENLEYAKQQGITNVNNRLTKKQIINEIRKEQKLRQKQAKDNKIENTKKQKTADSLVKRIKKLIKRGKAPAEVLDAAKEFVKLNAKGVTDIDAFIENANSIVKGLTPSRATKKGDVKVTEAVDVKKVDEYTKKEKDAENQRKKEADIKAFEELTGLNSKDFTLEEMRKILYDTETDSKSPDQRQKEIQNKKNQIKQGLKNAFNRYAAVVDSIIKTGVDPFTGQKVDLTKDQKDLLKRFLNLDIGNMSATEALQALDSMVNFATNQSTGGMEAIVEFQEGKQEANDHEGKIEAKPLKFLLGGKYLGSFWNKFIAQLPETLNQMFKSQTTARLFERISGFQAIRDGAATGQRIANDISKAYYDKFINPGSLFSKIKVGDTKTMPNGKRFNDVSNDVERGLFAFMRRTVDGTKEEQQKEFDRRKGLVEQTIKVLKENGQTEKAEIYQQAYDKLLKDSNNINDVDSKTDSINKEAVEWMTNEWSKARPELENVSLNVYNRTLGKDLNYTPDSFSRLKNVKSEPALDKPLFQPDQNETIYDEETGVLKPKKPSYILPMEDGNTSRYVNLGFDSVNSRNLQSAYTDVNTAPGIQKLKGFMSSSSYQKIIPNDADRELLNQRFKSYVDAKRGITKGQQKWLKQLNRFAGLGVSRVLGGPTQFAKQLIPLVNTAINLANNPKAFIQGLVAATSNTEAIEWLNNSGVEIANRGIQAVTNLEGTDTRLENDSSGKAGKILDIINNAQKEWLQGFLVAPDKFAARASFLGYYIESLNKQGIDTSNMNWKTHESNAEALQYATQQTARQQNTSDTDLQGSLFSGKDAGTQVFRKVFLPFANFLLNQKTRMYNDIGNVFSRSNTTQDKLKAGKSLVGLVGETAAFNALGLFITQSLATIAKEIRGTDEDEETLEKQLQSRIKGRAGQVVSDILSPIPILNPEVTKGVNAMIETFSDKEEPLQFFVNEPESLVERLGTLGIGFQKATQIKDMVMLGLTGKYKDKFGRTIEIDPQYKNDILTQAPIYTLYLLGALPLEAGSIIDYNMRAYKKTKVGDNKKEATPLKKPKKKKKKSTTKRRKKTTTKPILDNSGLLDNEGLL